MTTAAGFLLASPHQISWKLLFETLIGIGLVIAAACVFNNVIDKSIDSKMARTSSRAIPTGKISTSAAVSYASVLLVVGLTELSLTTNWYVFISVFVALYFYVVIYGLAKRRTEYSTLIGTIPGAIPPAAGYLAVSDHINGAVWLLFLAWTFWQLPHFYSIAMYRFKDYQAAGLPVLPIKRGNAAARRQVIAYIAAFMAACGLLSIYGYAGWSYLGVMAAFCVYWLGKGIKKWGLADEKWGRMMFLTSLIVNIGWSLLTAVGGRLP